MRPFIALALMGIITACEEAPDTNGACDGVPPVEWDVPVIDVDTTFSCIVRYSGDLRITGGAMLTLEPGARLELGGGSRVFVDDGGILHAVGTADLPVTVTSSSSAPAAGDWQFIDVGSTADGATRFEHAVLEYGGGNSAQGLMVGDGSFDLDNVLVRHATLNGLSLVRGRVRGLVDVHVEDVGGHPIELELNHVEAIDGLTADRVGNPTMLVSASRALEVDAVWTAESLPYELRGSMALRADLTIDAGVDLWMTPGARILVQTSGKLDLLGTEADPVVLQSASMSPQPGDWQHVNCDGDADSSLWRWAQISHGGGGSHGAANVEDHDRLSLDNVTFTDNLECDIDAIIGTKSNVPAVDTDYILCPD